MKDFQSIACFGEVLWDLLPTGKVLGGAPANVAYRLTSLGLKPKIISAVGTDDLGKELISQLSEQNLDVSFIQSHNQYPTGTVKVTLNSEGNPRYEIVEGVAYDFIQYSKELKELAETLDIFIFGTLVQRSAQTANTVGSILESMPNAIKVLDINLRKNCYSEESIIRSLNAASIVKLNESEQKLLTAMLGLKCSAEPFSFAEALMQHYDLSKVLITHGEKGVFAADSRGDAVHVSGKSVKVVDTIGAGDAFTAGFTYGLILNKDLKGCCEIGNLLGGATAGVQGGMGPLEDYQLRTIINGITGESAADAAGNY